MIVNPKKLNIWKISVNVHIHTYGWIRLNHIGKNIIGN